MSSRTFRDRYVAAAGFTAENIQERPSSDCWPPTDGARERAVTDESVVIHEHLYDGPEVHRARHYLDDRRGMMRSPGLRAEDLVFLDTETTGLSGGAGTYVFLVAIGQFHGNTLRVRQFFMHHPGHERAFLTALATNLAQDGSLVTYNGRSFDVPLLESRFRIHGWRLDHPDMHLDLLPVARAIWKHRLPNCSLGALERAVLGVIRDHDAPGWMIPQLYFEYLRSHRIELLDLMFDHNRADIVSLARLTALVHAYEAGIATPLDDIDRLALALHRLRHFGTREALDEASCLWRVLTIPVDLRVRALRALSTSLKRSRLYEEADAEWRHALNDPSRAIRLYAAEELAKYLEHRRRDLEQARAIAVRGADGATLAGDDIAARAFQQRVRRLERKLQATRAGDDLSG